MAAGLADRSRVERQLGRGAMATVYLAHDLGHGDLVGGVGGRDARSQEWR
jgi:hypothetical protein